MVDLTIRPNRRRHVRPAVALAVVLGLFLLCAGGKVLNDHLAIRLLPLELLLVLVLMPALALGTLTALSIRNLALRTDHGRLFVIGWTGRAITLRPASAHLYPIGSASGTMGELLVLTDLPGEGAAVLVPTWWPQDELQSLLTGLNLTVRTEAPIGAAEISRRYPRARLPLSIRHPWLFSGGTVAFAMLYVGVLAFLVSHL